MGTEVLPRNKEELKEFIIEIIREISERFVPYISEEEQKELKQLYKDSLEEDYKKKDYIRL